MAPKPSSATSTNTAAAIRHRGTGFMLSLQSIAQRATARKRGGGRPARPAGAGLAGLSSDELLGCHAARRWPVVIVTAGWIRVSRFGVAADGGSGCRSEE